MDTQVLHHGLCWAGSLGLANFLLERHTKRNPKGALARQVKNRFFDMPVHTYVVATSGQAFLQPTLWLLAYLTRDTSKAWWFGIQQQWYVGEFLAHSFGYFLQDAASHWDQSPLVLLHHVASSLAAYVLARGACWQGFLLTMAQIGELGSLSVQLYDLGFVSRRLARVALLWSSALPIAFSAAALLFGGEQIDRPDVPSGCMLALVLVMGIMRIRETPNLA
mmetsp:Transcript_97922/g.204251  ORF Transcript_97922/g.204251 Transcript_97922/m.204251 type:complete len:221 (-) Transcript_97922:493-1155(-)